MTTNEEERYDVFLGGSCGGRKSPTSWRKEVAIPLLLKNRVKFYNPQVDTWTVDLVHKENTAKDKSHWLLFMLEMTTRGIASMVEIAYLIGLGRSVVFVLQKDRKHGKIRIPDDHVSNEELDDIIRSQRLLTEMVALHTACMYCNVLKSGLKHVIRSLKQSAACTNAAPRDDLQKTAVRVRSYVSKAAAGVFKNILTNWAGEDSQGHSRRKRSRKAAAAAAAQAVMQRDIGIIGNIPSIVEDQLRNSGLRILSESCADSSTKTYLPVDLVAELLSCRVLLVFVPSDSLACSVMCKAAYYIPQHKNTVVCVQDIPEKSTVLNGHVSLTTGALRDYNRGRTYLRDVGLRQGSFVCEDIGKAVQEAVTRAVVAFPART